MSIEQALIAEVRSLTPQQQKEVLNFAAFLRQRSLKTVDVSSDKVSTQNNLTPGLHADIPYWIADDFNAPLPDSFWLGGE